MKAINQSNNISCTSNIEVMDIWAIKTFFPIFSILHILQYTHRTFIIRQNFYDFKVFVLHATHKWCSLLEKLKLQK